MFVAGYIKEQKVEHILVDGGSAINIMPKSTMHDLGITIKDLSKSWTMIQGFNLEGQRAIGGERNINGNVKPFTKDESHFAGARFLEEDDTPKKIVPASITSTGKGTIEKVIQVPKADAPVHQLQKEEN